MKSNITKLETCCSLCGSANHELVTTGTDHEYDNTTDDVFTLVRCTECGLVYLNPRPDISELPTIYPPNYVSYVFDEAYDERQRKNLFYKLRNAAIVSTIERGFTRFFPLGSRIKVLDIGCGDGYMLDFVRQAKTHETETYGVDIDLQAVERAKAKGHVTYAGRFEEVEFPDSYFDFVYAHHVIEHVADPVAFTLKVRELLKSGGIFCFFTPNIDALDARWFKHQHWGAYCIPRHWTLFSPPSVKRLANLTAFELVDLTFQPLSVNWNLTFHSLVKASPRMARYADILFPTAGWHTITLANCARNSIFTGVDLMLKLFTGQTANMGAFLRKPH